VATARSHGPIRRTNLTNTPDVAGRIAVEVVKLVAVIVVLLILARGKPVSLARTLARSVGAVRGIGIARAPLSAIEAC
jgi:formate dehydrogenase assembly factor FdhD